MQMCVDVDVGSLVLISIRVGSGMEVEVVKRKQLSKLPYALFVQQSRSI